ncbi:MAG: hypothetical protein HY690_08185 [Chloroflexi bacterium]|nr:hypothetical protein [Chloroflexota bacterium]
MDIAAIDFWANSGRSVFHRASALSKTVGALLVVAGVVLSLDVVVLATIYLALAAAVVSTRLPARRILLIGAYPAVFALLFALSRWDGTWITPAMILLKALAAALAMLLLITTTPYPLVFATFRRFLPGVVVDALFLTYRSLFLLLDLFGHLLTALRLRGGLAPHAYARNARNLAQGLGLLLIRALDLSERMSDVLRLRGYRGHLGEARRWRALSRYDLIPILLGLGALSLALASRLLGQTLGGYNGLVLLLALLAVLASAGYAHWPARTKGSP